MPARLLVASNNIHKVEEFRAILRPLGIDTVAPRELGLTLTVEETGTTFAANAALKAEVFARVSGMTAVADDSGLVVDALGGEPGIYSARYGGPEASDADRIRLVLERLAGVPGERRTARFVCAIAVSAPGKETSIVERAVEGLIAPEARGSNGFGYDPIFYYPPFAATFGQVDSRRKAAVSHRGRALRAAADLLRERYT